MKILTTVKKVVDVELNIHIENGAIIEDGLQYVINAWDENARALSLSSPRNSIREGVLPVSSAWNWI